MLSRLPLNTHNLVNCFRMLIKFGRKVVDNSCLKFNRLLGVYLQFLELWQRNAKTRKLAKTEYLINVDIEQISGEKSG